VGREGVREEEEELVAVVGLFIVKFRERSFYLDNTRRIPRPDDVYRVEKEKFLKKQWEERESERRKKSWWRW